MAGKGEGEGGGDGGGGDATPSHWINKYR